MISIRSLAVTLVLVCIPTSVFAHEEDDSKSDPYRGATLRLGAFAIDNVKARLYFGPTDIPLRGVIDIQDDLGLTDSLLAFRASFMYRFSKHNAIGFGYYKLKLDGVVRLSRTVELGGQDFTIGLDILSHYEEQITKAAYNFIFHDDGKVLLSITPGLHFSKARLSMEALGAVTGLPGAGEREDASVSAPLPMLGGRLVYRLNPKWSIVAVSDIFFLDRGSQEGQLTDTYVFVEYQTNSHFTLGGGLNRFSLDLQLVDDDIIWDWESVYTGAYLYIGYKF